jgi:hypothetical protein
VGCIPLPPQKQELFNAGVYEGTGIVGACPTTRFEVEDRQRRALEVLPALFYTGEDTWQKYMLNELQQRRMLSDFYGNPSSSSTEIKFANDDTVGNPEVKMLLEAVNGAFCITSIEASQLRVNTTVLTEFLLQLPNLKKFSSNRACDGVTCAVEELPASPVPVDLAVVAPAALTSFELTGNNLTGSLPNSWGQWSTIQELTITQNPLLSGSLPDWGGMASLTSLSLAGNGFTGTLPATYGSGVWSTTLKQLSLEDNMGLIGTIPSAWASMKATIEIGKTGLGGCVPDQLLNTLVYGGQPVVKDGGSERLFTGLCSQNNAEAAALLEVKQVLGLNNPGLSTWTGAPPGYNATVLPGVYRCSVQCRYHTR